jgi:hypothetical protein
MGRIINTLFLALMIGGAVVTYDMKHKAELAADRVARLQSDIAKEKTAIQTLNAEWSLLDQPGRLQALVQHYDSYFHLQTFSTSQLATIGEIPMREAPPAADAIADAIGSAITRTASASR